MLDRNEIEKSLKGVSRKLCVAFSARCALRVLPLLASELEAKAPFAYWAPEERSKHLLAVLTAQRFGVAFSLDIASTTSAVVAAADAAAYASPYGSSAAYAASASAYAASSYFDSAAYSAAYSSYSVAAVYTDLGKLIETPTLKDLSGIAALSTGDELRVFGLQIPRAEQSRVSILKILRSCWRRCFGPIALCLKC